MTQHRLAIRTVGALVLALLALGVPQGVAEEATPEYTPEQLVAKYGSAVVVITGRDSTGSVKSLGSGFLVTPDGRIVTNYHVARGAYPATVKLTTGDIYDDISVIDYDARRDLAILKVKGFNLPVVELGDSDKVAQGARVVVIGNPLGLENSVSDGLWSGARDFGAGFKLQQMTAPISPGNSGGPVFDTHGRVIGVATLSLVEGQNLNFFVPINYARGLIDGPVKCGLEDLPQEKLGLEAVSGSRASTQVETLKLLIEAVTDYCQGWDCVEEGMGHCRPAYRSVAGDYYPPYVDSQVYRASEFFTQAAEKAARAADGSGEAAKLALRYYISFRKIAAAHDARIDVLLDSPKTYEAEDERYATTYHFAWEEADGLASELKKLVQAQAPELQATLPPGVVGGPPTQPGEGWTGMMLATGSPEPRVIVVWRHSPAAKGGVKLGDVLLGVVGGPDFATQDDVVRYLRSHPSQKVILRVRRGSKEARLAITPEPYKED